MRYISLILISLVFSACSEAEKPEPKEESIPVDYTTVKKIPRILTISKSGVVSKRKQTALSFKIGGYINKISVFDGQTVKKGQLLAKLDLTEIQSRMNQAMINMDKSKRDLKRIENLYADSVATYQQLQDTQSAFDLAKSTLKIATYNFENAQIVAPNSGKILRKLAEEDQLIQPGQPIFFVSDNESKTIIKIGVSDKDFMKLQLGDHATVSFDFLDKPLKATIIERAATANETNGLFDIALEIKDASKHGIITGMIGQVKFEIDRNTSVLTIPMNALSNANKMTATVYILNDELNSVSQRTIEILEIINGHIAIKDGLSEEQKIVTHGVLYLYDNAKVHIYDEDNLFTDNVSKEK